MPGCLANGKDKFKGLSGKIEKTKRRFNFMERILNREQGLLKTFGPALIVAGVAFAMITIAYGMDSVASGVHDTFHDFRHVIGMACH